MASSSTTCDICTESYNTKTKKCVTCRSCNFACCTVCLVNYFKTSKATPQCMSCHRPWNHQYLVETFGAVCLKRILEDKKELLVNEQKALFPHTQEYIKLFDEKEEVAQAIRAKLAEIKEAKKELDNLYSRKNRLDNRMHLFESDCLNPQTSAASTVSKTPSSGSYVQQCNKPNCKGFIDNAGVCGLCTTVYCKRCMVHKHDDNTPHVCNESDVLSVEAIKKDSKSCPNCTTLIHRISGCPDMFCTSCYTSFNWNTLRIDTNGNSNPLYYKWLREGAGLPSSSLNGNCNEIVFDIHYVFRSTCYKNELSGSARQSLSDTLQSLHHVHHEHRYMLRGHFNRNVNYETLTLKYRKDFMKNKSSEKNFKTQLLRIQKQLEYDSNIRQMAALVEDFRNDSIRRVVLSSNEQKFDFKEYMQSYMTFSEYINNCTKHITKLFYNQDNVEMIKIPHFELNIV